MYPRSVFVKCTFGQSVLWKLTHRDPMPHDRIKIDPWPQDSDLTLCYQTKLPISTRKQILNFCRKEITPEEFVNYYQALPVSTKQWLLRLVMMALIMPSIHYKMFLYGFDIVLIVYCNRYFQMPWWSRGNALDSGGRGSVFSSYFQGLLCLHFYFAVGAVLLCSCKHFIFMNSSSPLQGFIIKYT